MKIVKNLNKVERSNKTLLHIQKISSKDKDRYNVKKVPTLIIDNKVISSGKVLSEREISNYIKAFS